jgi:hypothetical protein
MTEEQMYAEWSEYYENTNSPLEYVEWREYVSQAE